MSSVSESAYTLASRFADARLMMTCAPTGMVTPPEIERFDRVAERRVREPARRSAAVPPARPESWPDRRAVERVVRDEAEVRRRCCRSGWWWCRGRRRSAGRWSRAARVGRGFSSPSRAAISALIERVVGRALFLDDERVQHRDDRVRCLLRARYARPESHTARGAHQGHGRTGPVRRRERRAARRSR